MRKPSILFINRVYPLMRGATGRLLQDLARALDASGWRIHIITTGSQSEIEKNDNITVQRVKESQRPRSTLGYLSEYTQLKRAALKHEPCDVVVTLTDPPLLSLIGEAFSKKYKVPHIHWSQDVYPDLFPLLGVSLPEVIQTHLQRRIFRTLENAHSVVAIGRCMEDHLRGTGLLSNKIKLIQNWPDLEIIHSNSDKSKYITPIDAPTFAKKPEEMHRDNSPKFRILYAGNIGRAHPMKAIVEAAEILSEHKEIEFVFIGDRDTHTKLAQDRAIRGLENIKFMPYQPIEKLREIMESGDIHLVSMSDDVLGRLVPSKFYSAITVGRPTIFMGPHKSEIANVIKEYKAGKIIDVNNAKALADAIYKYRHNGDQWFKDQEGALRAAQLYNPTQSLNKWLDLLEKARVS